MGNKVFHRVVDRECSFFGLDSNRTEWLGWARPSLRHNDPDEVVGDLIEALEGLKVRVKGSCNSASKAWRGARARKAFITCYI